MNIYEYLDQNIGKDLIEVVHNAKAIFGLTDKEFYDIFIKWEAS